MPWQPSNWSHAPPHIRGLQQIHRAADHVPASKSPRTARIVGADGKVWAVDADRAGRADPADGVRFSFRLSDASEPGTALVLILDGVVYDPNSDGIDPSGMPSGDTYQLEVADGDEIWAECTLDQSTGTITSVSLNNGAATPDNAGGIAYKTIGHVKVDSSGATPVVTPTNEICGDIVFEVLPTTGLDEDKNWIWGFDSSDGNQKWIAVCVAECGATKCGDGEGCA